MSSRGVKEYLSQHHLSQLLESLLTGLLYHHPEDPISFLHSCLITTRQLGGPEAVAWDTFIHLERHHLNFGSAKSKSTPPRPPPVASVENQIPKTTPQPSVAPESAPGPPRPATLLRAQTPQPPPLLTAPKTPPALDPQTGRSKPEIPPCTLGVLPPTPTIAPLPQSRPQSPSIWLRNPVSFISNNTIATPKLVAPPGPELPPPPVHSERKEQQDAKTGGTEAPCTGPPPSPVRSQLSIDSDSDMTESSGLLQEVSTLPPKRPCPPIIFIIGGPGSGKGRQAARLAQCFSLRVVSLDELLRRQLLRHASPSRKWRVISEMMGLGELGPQEDTISELKQQLIGQQGVRGFIVDGFPRDIHQALSFQDQIGSPDLVMLLLCSNKTLRCRLQRRATELGLLGDNSHALRRRLETFERDIVSICRYYRQLHLLTQVEADRDEQLVFADLSSVIRDKLPLKDSSDPADFPGCSSVLRDVNQ